MSESKLIHNHLLTSENNSLLVNDETRYDFRGDYLGFTFDGIHSSKLGIVRTSDGNKYNENLTPTFSDITATAPGLDETYYFGSNFTQATTTIKFSFDNLTDTQIRKLKKLFSQKEPKDLIFDEVPYKVYSAKPQSVPTLSYLCFDDGEKRIYKGEGTITFVAYSPFARSRFKYLDDYTLENIPEWKGNINDSEIYEQTEDENIDDTKDYYIQNNGQYEKITNPTQEEIDNYYELVHEGIFNNKEEWKDSSGLVSSNSQIQYDSDDIEEIDALYIIDNNSSISLYNQSDFSIPAKILIQFNGNLNDIDELTISLNGKDDEISNLTFDISEIKENENIKGLVINSFSRLVYPLLSELTTDWSVDDKQYYNDSKNWNYNKNTIYNKYIVAGDFFDIPICSLQDETYIYVKGGGHCLAIDYKYLYY